MGVFGKLMDSMKIDQDYEDDDYIDDGGYEDAPRNGIFKRNKQDEDYDYPEEETPKRGLFGSKNQNSGNVTPVRRQMEVCMVKPSSVDESRMIVDCLLSGKAVVLNMEGIATEIAQRILDFTSGATYSMNGKLQRISTFIFIATPSQVELSGDFQDMLNSGQLDMSGINMRF